MNHNVRLQFFSRRIAELIQGHSKVAMISISTPGDEIANIQEGFRGVLRLQFGDDDGGEENSFTRTQAKEILDFVNDVKEDVKDIIVHCDAGLSRSPGVCEALFLVFNAPGLETTFPKFRLEAHSRMPNIHVKTTILREAWNDSWGA